MPPPVAVLLAASALSAAYLGVGAALALRGRVRRTPEACRHLRPEQGCSVRCQEYLAMLRDSAQRAQDATPARRGRNLVLAVLLWPLVLPVVLKKRCACNRPVWRAARRAAEEARTGAAL
ncbi:hypothetical protein J0910_15735 [Nocardiopsis sp. CNT-189]|uniref:hypothetical protein n=1 Tax=Nocardiopsis oceanisediminis TaxID=2816862 RepID=UPI003B314822